MFPEETVDLFEIFVFQSRKKWNAAEDLQAQIHRTHMGFSRFDLQRGFSSRGHSL